MLFRSVLNRRGRRKGLHPSKGGMESLRIGMESLGTGMESLRNPIKNPGLEINPGLLT
jgi:hypothetical protein